MPIVIEDSESDATASKADFSDFPINGMKWNADSLDDLEASSKATTPFSPSKLCELGDAQTEMTLAENDRNSKRKAWKKRRQSQSKCKIL